MVDTLYSDYVRKFIYCIFWRFYVDRRTNCVPFGAARKERK
jgi:hypothetical protein